MRRVGDLWDELTSFPNLARAAWKASRRKRSLVNVARFNLNLERGDHQAYEDRIRTYEPPSSWSG